MLYREKLLFHLIIFLIILFVGQGHDRIFLAIVSLSQTNSLDQCLPLLVIQCAEYKFVINSQACNH